MTAGESTKLAARIEICLTVSIKNSDRCAVMHGSIVGPLLPRHCGFGCVSRGDNRSSITIYWKSQARTVYVQKQRGFTRDHISRQRDGGTCSKRTGIKGRQSCGLRHLVDGHGVAVSQFLPAWALLERRYMMLRL